jgi:hypothetical protein
MNHILNCGMTPIPREINKLGTICIRGITPELPDIRSWVYAGFRS